jgi:hypothetical protein
VALDFEETDDADMAEIVNHPHISPLTTTDTDGPRTPRLTAPGMAGVASFAAAATFVVGIAMFATMLREYTGGDPTPAESVQFVAAHQTTLFVWYLVILIAFGTTLVPIALALRTRLRVVTPGLADATAAFGLIWAGLMFATGMVSNIGIEVVADLARSQPEQAPGVWASIDAVTNGLGGGNELVGGLWLLLVSTAAWSSAVLPKWLGALGTVTGVAGLATLVPGFDAAEMAFGVGLVAWFVGVGIVLTSDRRPCSTER